VNIGALLQRISDNKIKATMHRVVDIGVKRYSCPFFFDPKFSARVTTNILKSSRTKCEDLKYELDPSNQKEMEGVVTYGELVSTRMLQFVEMNGF
jgi:isopenicillin N synthase-like dioxygenase